MCLLYKYLPINRLGFEGIGFFPHLQLKFSSVSNFNDPSECSLKYEWEKDNPDDLSLFSKDYTCCSRKSKTLHCDEVFKYERDAYFGNYGILSLSRNPYSSLMWSHYASGHTGFVVGLDSTYFTKKYKAFRSDGKYDMFYESRTPIIPAATYKLPIGILYWKGVSWSYEEEVRFIKKKSSIEKIPSKYVKEIIFGYNMPVHTRIAVMKMAENLNLKNIEFKKTVFVELESGIVELDKTSIERENSILGYKK